MKRHNALWICSTLITISLLGWAVRPAVADVSDACRGLSGRFANAAEEMGTRSLAALLLCVSKEIGQRVGVAMATPPETAPPAVEEAPAPSPESQAPTTPPNKPYGDWPQPAPWGGGWPQGEP